MTTQNDLLAKLLATVKQYDDEEVTQPESAPTGTDYNRLYGLVMGYAKFIDPVPTMPPEQEPGEPTRYECSNCDWTGTLDTIAKLDRIDAIEERLEPGELVPAGCCPECNSLIPVDDRDVPHYTLFEVGLIMRQRGWAVAAPDDCPSLDTTKGA